MKQVIISTTLPQHTAPNTNLKQNLRNTTLHSPRPACQKGSMRVHYELHSRRLSLEVRSEFHRPPVEHGFILLVQYIDRVVSLRKGCVHDADGVVGSAGRRHLTQRAVMQIILNRLQHVYRTYLTSWFLQIHLRPKVSVEEAMYTCSSHATLQLILFGFRLYPNQGAQPRNKTASFRLNATN